MAAASSRSTARKLPLKLGLLRVSGVILEGERQTDLLDVTSAPGGDVGVVLLDLQPPPGASGGLSEAERARRRLTALAIRGFRERTPLHAIMLDLARGLFESPASELRVTLLRCSPADARVEVTTAGMPPVACVHADGHLTLHGVAAPPLTASVLAPPAVELAALTWDSTWLVVSDGFSPSAEQATVVRSLAHELQIADEGAALSQLPASALQRLLETAGFGATRAPDSDASLVLVSADPSARFQSGIQRGGSRS